MVKSKLVGYHQVNSLFILIFRDQPLSQTRDREAEEERVPYVHIRYEWIVCDDCSSPTRQTSSLYIRQSRRPGHDPLSSFKHCYLSFS